MDQYLHKNNNLLPKFYNIIENELVSDDELELELP